MEESLIYSNVASELLEIFKYLDRELKEKIPHKLKESLERIQNKEHKLNIDKTKTLNEQSLLPQTRQILSIIYGEPTLDYSYNTACDSIEKLILDNKIFEAIRISQFNNNDTFYKLIGKENYHLIDKYLKKINYFCLLRWKKDVPINDIEAAKIIVMKALLESDEAKNKIQSLCTKVINDITSKKKIVYIKQKIN